MWSACCGCPAWSRGGLAGAAEAGRGCWGFRPSWSGGGRAGGLVHGDRSAAVLAEQIAPGRVQAVVVVDQRPPSSSTVAWHRRSGRGGWRRAPAGAAGRVPQHIGGGRRGQGEEQREDEPWRWSSSWAGPFPDAGGRRGTRWRGLEASRRIVGTVRYENFMRQDAGCDPDRIAIIFRSSDRPRIAPIAFRSHRRAPWRAHADLPVVLRRVFRLPDSDSCTLIRWHLADNVGCRHPGRMRYADSDPALANECHGGFRLLGRAGGISRPEAHLSL